MKLNIHNEGSSYNVRISGELDTTTAPLFSEKVSPLTQIENADVCLDCAELEYLSSKGIRVLLSFQQAVVAGGGKVSLVNLSESVQDILKLTGLYDSLCQ